MQNSSNFKLKKYKAFPQKGIFQVIRKCCYNSGLIQQYKNTSVKIIHRGERSNIKDQILHSKMLETEQKIKFKVRIRKEIIEGNRNMANNRKE